MILPPLMRAQAQIELLRDGKVLKVRVQLKGPHKLIPSHIGCVSVTGLVQTQYGDDLVRIGATLPTSGRQCLHYVLLCHCDGGKWPLAILGLWT